MSFRPNHIRGFYSILDREDVGLARSLLASSRLMQVRKKPASAKELASLAHFARRLSAHHGALLIVNDDIELAHAVSADGVHLGQDDTPLAVARRHTDLFIGVSTHNQTQLAEALAGGADYVAFGPIFATTSKENPDPVRGLERLRRAVTMAGETPVVAIGGITPSHAVGVYETGASAACVISAVNDASDPRAAARAIAEPWGVVR